MAQQADGGVGAPVLTRTVSMQLGGMEVGFNTTHQVDDADYYYRDFRAFLGRRRNSSTVRLTNKAEKSAVFLVVQHNNGRGSVRPSSAAAGVIGVGGGETPELARSATVIEVPPNSRIDKDFPPRVELHVCVGVLSDTVAQPAPAPTSPAFTRTLQMLDVGTISGNKELVLRQPRLSKPFHFRAVNWPCTPDDILQVVGRTGWNSNLHQFSKEGHSGIDRLGYRAYATALAGLFSTGKDALPAAVGISAPWGGGKSFLLRELKMLLEPDAERLRTPTGLYHVVVRSVAFIIICKTVRALMRFFLRVLESAMGSVSVTFDISIRGLLARIPYLAKRREDESDQDPGAGQKRNSGDTDFIVVEFNAWEVAGSDVLWAAVVSKIFDTIEGHPDFGRGAVRAARINQLLDDPTWNYAWRWTTATLGIPFALTLLKLLLEMRNQGSLGTAQGTLRSAISKKESSGASYLGFMSDVKEELQILFEMINELNERRVHKLALVVIVDDLDRCPKDNVMEMLKATHLLLEHPKAPMAVFLAVDPQLIISAISESLDGVPNTGKALEYLDKIIHLPFCIPPISEAKRLNLVEVLLNGTTNSSAETLHRTKMFVKWPHDQDLEEWKTSHALRAVLKDQPEALELACYLDVWEAQEGAEFPLPVEAMETMGNCYGRLKMLDPTGTGFEAECLNIVEELNRKINQILPHDDNPLYSRYRQSVPQHSDAGETTVEVRGGLPGVVEAGLSFGGSRGIETEVSVFGLDPWTAFRANPLFPMRVQPNALPFGVNVSPEESETFLALFRVVKATPRKMKRVVNVYFLQRYSAQVTVEKDAQALIKWTVLAEFWPFRLSCIVFAMMAEAQLKAGSSRESNTASVPPPAAAASVGVEEWTIASVYDGSTGYFSVRKWLEKHRRKEGKLKDLCLSDDSEGRFLTAIKVGAPIARKQVMGKLLGNSFNLNPAILSMIEAEMAEASTSSESRVAKLKLSEELLQMLRNNRQELRDEEAKGEHADSEEIEHLQGQQREIRKAMEKDAEEKLEKDAEEKFFRAWRRGRNLDEQEE
eukprot:g1581.t1